MLDFIEKGPAGAQGALHPEATTKEDLDAFAAKILAAVSVQPQVSPATSWPRSYSSVLTNSPPQSFPQSALTRMTASSAAPISSRQAREIRVKTNFNNDHRPRAGHSRTSKEVVNMANEGISRAGLRQGPQGVYPIEMATVQVSGDYLLLAKDAATAERLIKNGPKWVTCLGGNAEVITPTYGVMVMNIPVSTFNPQEQQQMKQMLIGGNYQLLNGYEINHLDWLLKPKPGQTTGTMVISFLSKAGANAALAAEVLAWEGGVKRTVRYSRACRVLQCFRCYEYGHATHNCRNSEKCGHCAQEHLTKDCLTPNGTKTCTLCKGNHPAWAQSCKYRKQEMERVEAEKQKVRQQPYFQEDPVITSGPSERGSVVSFDLPGEEDAMDERPNADPTPAEAAATPSRASQVASQLSSQGSRARNPELSTILKKNKVSQRVRPYPVAKPQSAKISAALQAKKRAFGPATPWPAREERQCEPGSDAIVVVDSTQQLESSPPPAPAAQWTEVPQRRRSVRSSITRTQDSPTTNEWRHHKAQNNTVQRRQKIRGDG